MIEPIYYTRDIEGNYHPAADLKAHDARVRREALDGAWGRVKPHLVRLNHGAGWQMVDPFEIESAIRGQEAK